MPLFVNDDIKKSAVIVILSGGAYESGLLDFDTFVRLKKGIELYRSGWADKIICSGGIWYNRLNKSIAELMKEWLIFYGVPSHALYVQDETKDTYHDINYTIHKFSKQFQFNNSIFVSSSYHTYRVKSVLNKMGIGASVISAEPYELYANSLERFRLFKQIIREYLVIIYFKLYGYI